MALEGKQVPKTRPFARSFGNYSALFRMAASLLIIVSGTAPLLSQAEGLMPTLDLESSTGQPDENTMTPITEITGSPLADAPLTSSAPANTPADDSLIPLISQPASGELTPLIAQPAASPTESEAGLELTPLHPDSASSVPASLPSLGTDATHPESASTASQNSGDSNFQLKGKASFKTEPTQSTPSVTASTTATGSKPALEKPKPEPTKTTDNKTDQLEKPIKPAKKPFQFSENLGQAIENTKSVFQDKAIKPVNYTSLPGIAVFAVLKHGNERVFGDLPVLFAREYAQRLSVKLPQTKIYNPVYTVDELRMQGLGHIYDQIMSYYVKTGAPEPTATDYLLKQISTNRPNISRIVFVEADVEFNRPDDSTHFLDRAKKLLTDDTPKELHYYVVSRLQIFDTEKPDFPLVWSGNWERTVNSNRFYNVTPSVYSDSDSQQAFSKVSRQMSQDMILVTPKTALMTPNTDTDVQGKLVSGKQPAFPNLPESQVAPKGLSHENKQAIERILQRQNEIGPK